VKNNGVKKHKKEPEKGQSLVDAPFLPFGVKGLEFN
jgi:hypothetical protein